MEVKLDVEQSSDEEVECEQTNYQQKRRLILDIVTNARCKKKEHRKRVGCYRRVGTCIKALVNVLNAMSVSSLIMEGSTNEMKWVALGTTSISATLSALSQALGLEQKTESHNSTYLALSDLTRDFSARLLRNHLTSDDLDTLLGELNARISLIEDAALI